MTLRLRFRRLTYSLTLRFLLITRLFSLLLLKLTHLLLSFLIASLGFDVKPVYFLFACLCPPAAIPGARLLTLNF